MSEENEENQEPSISDEQLSELIEKKVKDKMESKEVEAALKRASKLAGKASKLIEEATEELDKYGIGMYFSISPLSQNYVANGEMKATVVKEILEMHPDLDEDDLEEEVSDNLSNYEGFSSEYGDTGWQHSSVC